MADRSNGNTEAPPRTRGHRRLVGAVAVAALLVLVTAGQSAALDPAPTSTSTTAPAPAGPTVAFAGLTLPVPAGWSVVDLTATPTACVRFDVHAIYLGQPGADQSCPAGLRGRTEAVLVQPLAGATEAPDTTAAPAMAGVVTPTSASDEVRVAVPSAGVQVTGTWGTDPAGLQAVLAAGTQTPGWTPPPANRAASTPKVAATQRIVGTKGFVGRGFDTCAAPSLGAMNAWTASPYRAVGVYIGGNNRACQQANLTTSWVTSVTNSGWSIMPIYVGYQAPVNICGCRALTPSIAGSQGSNAADDAVAQAQSVGMGPGSPIYFDMEGYDRGSTNTPGVTAFLSAWSARLHALGYQSGVYSGSYSGLADLLQAGGSITQPDSVWYANWDGRNATLGDPYLPDSAWTHSRLHQYSTGAETWGGVYLSIDRNAVDTSLVSAVDDTPPPPPPPPPVTPSVPPATVRDYINRVFMASLGRGPTTDESNFWAWCFMGGTPTSGLVQGLMASDEWSRTYTAVQYMVLLHRGPDAGGADYWTGWLKQYRNPDVLAGILASSDEYWYHSGWDPTTYVTNLYRDLLGRSPDAGGLAYWANRVRSGESRFTIASTFSTVRERSEIVVKNAYVGLVRRAPDAAGLAYWVGVFEPTRDPAMVVVPLAMSSEAVNLGS